ncbi:MAG: ribbon-helix-helix domain-containing protein [Alphaproteobacteria bacterium]|jgi:predicted DNA-binding ribbon-helix-helix protein|nr:ribbon-helix-helix domain-containing protein [Alphaproteobacteria bacterium]MBT7943748.1 ribbon-helix-helix domain-containing protein [Alphaproteobacteria bacterium]
MYLGEKRSFRIHRRSTTVKLERPFWDQLEGIARARQLTLGDLIEKIDETCRTEEGAGTGNRNLASFIRVFCLTCPEAMPANPDFRKAYY